MKLTPGMKIENIVYNTPFRSNQNLADKVAGHKTMLLFLRYYGCTLCQYDMLLLKEQYAKIHAVSGQQKLSFSPTRHCWLKNLVRRMSIRLKSSATLMELFTTFLK